MAPTKAMKARRKGKPQVPKWTFGDRIRKARVASGLSLADVAEAFNVSPQAISNWERMQDTPVRVFEKVEKYEQLTGVPAEWLLTGKDMTLTYTSPFRRPPDGGEPIQLKPQAEDNTDSLPRAA